MKKLKQIIKDIKEIIEDCRDTIDWIAAGCPKPEPIKIKTKDGRDAKQKERKRL